MIPIIMLGITSLSSSIVKGGIVSNVYQRQLFEPTHREFLDVGLKYPVFSPDLVIEKYTSPRVRLESVCQITLRYELDEVCLV